MNDRGRYRRVYASDWQQSAVQSLNDSERVVWLYARTGPQSTSVGIYRLSTAVAVEDLGNVTPDEFDQRLEVVCRVFEWSFDPAVHVLWIPHWLEENPPQSPNVVISWRTLLGNVPDCTIKCEAVEAIHRSLKDMPEAFRKAFGNYRVRVPASFEKAKAKTKAKTEANQGSGIRDPGIRDTGGASRPGTEKGTKKSVSIAPKVLSLAEEVLVGEAPTSAPEYLQDVLQNACRQQKINLNRVQATMALAAARERIRRSR